MVVICKFSGFSFLNWPNFHPNRSINSAGLQAVVQKRKQEVKAVLPECLWETNLWHSADVKLLVLWQVKPVCDHTVNIWFGYRNVKASSYLFGETAVKGAGCQSLCGWLNWIFQNQLVHSEGSWCADPAEESSLSQTVDQTFFFTDPIRKHQHTV